MASDGGHHDISEDKAAAYTGFVMGAALLFLILFTIVGLTRRHYESREERARPAQTETAR